MWVPETGIQGLRMGQETRAAFEMVRGPNSKHSG